MKHSLHIKIFCFISIFSCSALVLADACEDVIWSDAVLNQYPFINEYCQEVVEKDGRSFVRIDGKFMSGRSGRAKIQLQRPDGELDDIYVSNKLSSNFRAVLDGKPTKLRDIPRRSELTIYLPPDRFDLVKHNQAPIDEQAVAAIDPVADPAIDADDIGQMAPMATLLAFDEQNKVLPMTASSLPLTALYGVLGCLAGLTLTIKRRYFR